MLSDAGARPARDEVGNVIAELGEGPAADALILAAHLDTVFDADTEIVFHEQDGRLAAPGLGDNSFGVAAIVHLARRLHPRRLTRRVVLAATVGEEGLGDLRGAKHLVETIDCDSFVAVEGMSLETIEVGGIGSERYRVTYTGAGGHPWSNRGTVSALHGLVTRAAELTAFRLSDEAVLNIGRVSGGTSINTIAASAVLELDLRARDPDELADLSQRAAELLGRAPEGLDAAVERVGRRPAGAIAPDHPLLRAARRARARAGLDPAGEGFSSTDANAAYGRGIPAITVGVSTGSNAHRSDEYIDEAPAEGGLRALELLAEELADG
jgi:acetylornithine deacetylase/succinyl-diaminopimelate desuccinylase-like protein